MALARSPSRGRAVSETPISQQAIAGAQASGFQRFQLPEELHRALVDCGFDEPRPVQAKAIPPAQEGRDVLGLAQTGTGKTAAFALPVLQRLLKGARRAPRALVITPTRELAAQVHAEFERLAQYTPTRAAVVFGGVPIGRQERELRRRAPEVVVACPGRLLDLLSRGALRLDHVEVLVLDEADHMFDMGFLPDVRRILRALPQRRQNLFFSATMPREVRRLADGILHKPAVVELGHSRPAETIDHSLCRLREDQKSDALQRLLSDPSFRSAVVFLRTKRRAKRLAERLARGGRSAVALQGNMSQGQRERALQGFRDGRFKILVATDIAARGLDIAGVSHVINFDMPGTPEAYTHRIGRTGRSGLTGKAFTFATPDDDAAVRAVERHLGKRVPVRTIDGRSVDRRNIDGSDEAREPRGSSRGRGRRSRTKGAQASRGSRGSKGSKSSAASRPAKGAKRSSTSPPAKGAKASKAAAPAKKPKSSRPKQSAKPQRGRESARPAKAPSDGPRFGEGI